MQVLKPNNKPVCEPHNPRPLAAELEVEPLVPIAPPVPVGD